MKLSPSDFKQYKLKRKFYELSNLRRKMKGFNVHVPHADEAEKTKTEARKSALEVAQRKYQENRVKSEEEKKQRNIEAQISKTKALKKRSNEKRLLYKKHKNGQPCLSTKMQYMMKRVYESVDQKTEEL